MNQKISGYSRLFIITLTLLAGTAAYSQNVPNTEIQPSGSANSFPAPSALNLGSTTNYTRSFSPMVPITNSDNISESSPASDVKIGTTFRDGFNRGFMNVISNFTGNTKKNLVMLVDNSTRQDGFSYLPYATSNSMDPVSDPYGASQLTHAYDDQEAYYNSLYPGEGYTSFSRTQYYSDNNQHIVNSYAPGKNLVGNNRGATTQSITNDADEIRTWQINGSGLPQSNGFYPADALFGSFSTNANGAKVTAFNDKDGKLVCRKELQKIVPQPGTPPSETIVYGITYCVYDEMGQLRYTIPPAATVLISGSGTLTQTQLDNLCYQYTYNNKGQVIRKKQPGKAEELFVYDKLGRLAFQKNGSLEANKWNFLIYDKNNRVLCNGTYTTGWETQQILQAYFYDNITYSAPYLISYQKNYELFHEYPGVMPGTDVFAYNYYDDYSVCDPTNTLWATYSNNLQFSEVMNSPGAEDPVPTKNTRGFLTGRKIRIFPAPDAVVAQTGEWRESVNFYDEKGRPIYNVSRDMNLGAPIHVHYAGTKYDFAGRSLISKHVSVNVNSTDGSHTELSRNYYDATTGALTQTQHKVDNGAWNVMALYTYDELGRVKRKVLGNYGEVRDFAYNIRGQLEGINPTYAMTGNKEGESRTFGEALRYDYGFTKPRYDGTISGMIWRGSTAASKNAYGYNYDEAGRLTAADYRKWEPASIPYWYDTWRNDKTDYSVSNLQYDLNGNIQSMKQRGMGIVSGNSVPVDIDDLTYDYETQSNKLTRVYDNATVDYGNGDFQNTNGTGIDYDYDGNGNLHRDVNKTINAITYNHLNKPVTVSIGAANTISYSYDADGNKVEERSTVGGVAKVTDYVGNFVYEGNILKFAMTPEGRSVYTPASHTFKEEFFVKDHLGNVRSVVDVYTYPIAQYLASYEVASANLEGLFFDDMDGMREDKPGSTDPGDNKAGVLNGDDPNRRVGTSTLLKVMAGDKVELNVNSFYNSYDATDDTGVPVEEMLGNIISTMSGGAGGFNGSESHNSKVIDDVFHMGNFAVYSDMVNVQTDPAKPKAYLNYILFDETMKMVKEMSGAFQATGNGGWAQIGTSTPMVIPANGYLAVYLSNATIKNSDVFFDQLVIKFSSGKLKEESHYYPFGLPIGSLGSTAAGFMPNKQKYQSNEYNKDLGLNWMDFHNRQYDPQLGRFLSIDPLAEATANLSPYTAMNNDPANQVDPLGLQSGEPPHMEKVIDYIIRGNATSGHGSPVTHPDRWSPFGNRSVNAPGGGNYAAEDEAFYKSSMAAAKAAYQESLGEAMGEPLSTEDMCSLANNSPGVVTNFSDGFFTGYGTLLPDLPVRGGKADYKGWGQQMDDRFGGSLGWDFEHYAGNYKWYNWDGPLMRFAVPDKLNISIGGDIAGFFGVGAQPVNFTLLTRGHDPGIYLTPSFSVKLGGGGAVSGGVSFASSTYTGDSRDITADMLLGNTWGITAGGGRMGFVSAGLSFSPTGNGQGFVNRETSLGFGFGGFVGFQYQNTTGNGPVLKW